ncbi:MAG: DUF2244 domain-containing protein [Hyphomicrobiaceae bacterium]
MDENRNQAQVEPQFRAILTPHRSLTPAGFVILMTALGGISFVAGMLFLTMGAWPVTGFFGLDVLLVYAAFKLSYRSGRLCEIVELTPASFSVTRVYPSGRRERFDLNPYWARVNLQPGRHGRTDLRVRCQGRELAFGRFLTEAERRDFASVLKGELLQARGGARI